MRVVCECVRAQYLLYIYARGEIWSHRITFLLYCIRLVLLLQRYTVVLPPPPPAEVALLTDIRDQLAKLNSNMAK